MFGFNLLKSAGGHFIMVSLKVRTDISHAYCLQNVHRIVKYIALCCQRESFYSSVLPGLVAIP